MPAEQSISIGPVIVGVLISAYLCGAYSCQIGVYFFMYPTDPKKLKLLVACVWFLDFLQEVLVCCTLYYYAVQHRANLGAPPDKEIPWQLLAGVVVNCTLIALCQGFFALRVWKFSHGNRVLACLIASPLAGGLALGYSVGIITLKNLSFHTVHSTATIYNTMVGLHAGCDCLITGALMWLIWKQKEDSMRHRNVVARILALTFHTGAVPCLGTLANLIILLTIPNKGLSIGMYAVMGRLYSNAFLTMVNARKSLRDEVKRGNEVEISGISGIVASCVLRSAAIPTAGLTWSISAPAVESKSIVKLYSMFATSVGPKSTHEICAAVPLFAFAGVYSDPGVCEPPPEATVKLHWPFSLSSIV
ncbi:hypothetical protein OF83DRAFT_1173429 [Amylostereum chailletii]|nr:hypothetical protein OF83DRAFT_1173429 [Amylostereum chailletii]